MSASFVAIQEGQKVGNYKVLSRLGVGGMGAVYLAEHPLIGKKVALKAIHKEFAHNKEVVARFFREAKAVNKIGNEHIVEIHDFGQGEDGEHFFIMEYLQGPTLAEVLQKEGYLHPQRALHIGAQIAAGLAAAHACGIIHRDLKPDNIMLVPRHGDRDFVKILDFGLAKMFADASSKLTAQGVVLGTPQYMAPEACESKQDIDHRSDIYALGILLFQMLCGQVPFDGNTMGEILVKHVGQPPPALRAINAAIPPSVEQIVLRCLAKRRDDRFPTMKALREALLDSDRYLASSPPVMPSGPAPAKTMFGHAKQGAPVAPSRQPPAAGRPVTGGQPVQAPPAQAPAAVAPPAAAPQHYAAPTDATVAPGMMQAPPQFSGRNAPPPAAPPPAAPPPAAPPPAAQDPAKTVMLQEGQSLPLKPPPPSIPAAPAVGTAPASAKTAYIAGGNGGAALAATQPINGGSGGAVPSAGAGAKTAFMDNAVSFAKPPEMPKRTVSAVPELNPPAPPVNQTMVIGTPEGYSDKPPRKKWPLVLGLFVILAGGGAAAFFYTQQQSDDDAAQAGTDEAASDAGAAAKHDAATPQNKVAAKPDDKNKPAAAVDAGAAVKKPTIVTVRFKTSIEGAKVYDASDKFLCKTPCDLELPDDDQPYVVTIKHPRAKTRQKTIIARAGMEMTVDLERKPQRHHHRPRHHVRRHVRPRKKKKIDLPAGKKKVGDGVQDPDF